MTLAPVRRVDVVVVGAGLFGTSVAFQLARRGARSVLLVERDTVAAGDSGVCFSMIRCHYSNEATARLSMRGVDVIRRWPEEVGTGASGYVPTGYLLTAPEERLPALRENVRRLAAWGLETEVVGPAEIAELEPLLDLDGVAGGAFEPWGGFADAQAMTLSWFAAAVREGARAALGCPVRAIAVSGGRVAGAETGAGHVACDVLVLAAGGWSPELARTAGVELPIALHRVEVAVIHQPADRPRLRRTLSDIGSGVVLRPDRAGRALVVAYGADERPARRDDCPARLGPGYEERVRSALRARVPAYAEAEWLGGFAGAYDATPDWNPILGWAPGVEGLYLALGSGHGFKLAPAVGEVAAAAILGLPQPIDVSDLAFERFERGRTLRLAYGPGAKA